MVLAPRSAWHLGPLLGSLRVVGPHSGAWRQTLVERQGGGEGTVESRAVGGSALGGRAVGARRRTGFAEPRPVVGSVWRRQIALPEEIEDPDCPPGGNAQGGKSAGMPVSDNPRVKRDEQGRGRSGPGLVCHYLRLSPPSAEQAPTLDVPRV